MTQTPFDSYDNDLLEGWVDVSENPILPQHVLENLFSTDLHLLRQSCAVLHALLDQNFPPILSVVEAGLIPRLFELLDVPSEPIQLEAIWILARLASGPPEAISVLMSQGAVPKLANMMDSRSDELQDNASWALGNILGHPSLCHKLASQAGFGSQGLPLMRSVRPKTLFQSIFWAYGLLRPYIYVETLAPDAMVEDGLESWTFVDVDSKVQGEDMSRISSSRSSLCSYSDEELRNLLNASLRECLVTTAQHIQGLI
ncbi:hypothetical protein FRC04_005276 [Tulasnella sp. 424]|nr:hypothetical protein FRC04_005276 [Tulasnella sp. 424]